MPGELGNRMDRGAVFTSMAPIEFVDGSSFESASGEVHRHGTVVRLEPQPAAVLAVLAARPGELIAHDEMRRAVWGDATHVSFHEGLHYAIRQIRSAFDDNPRTPWLIETMPRRGYRLRATAVLPTAPPATPPTVQWRARGVVAVGALLLLFTTMWVERRPNNHHEVAVAVVRTVHDWLF